MEDRRKQELSEFLQKMDYEGGYQGLLGHSGTSLFPDAIKSAAEEYEFASNRLDEEIRNYAQELGFKDTNEAYEYYDDEAYD